MSKIEFNEIDLSNSGNVRPAPAPLEGFFVPGYGLIDSIGVNNIGYTLKPVIMLRPDQKRKIDEAKRHIENGNSRLAMPIFSGTSEVAALPVADEILAEGEEPVPMLEAPAPTQPDLVSLGFEVSLVLTLDIDGRESEPEIFPLATVEADIEDLYEEPGEDEEPLYLYNVVGLFDEHVKQFTDGPHGVLDALNKADQYQARAASVLAQNQSAAARTGEVPQSPEYQQLKKSIQTLDNNALIRIGKLITTPANFMDQAIGYDDPENEDEEPILNPVPFNDFYEYLRSVIKHPDDLAFKVLEQEAALRKKYEFAQDEASDEPAEEEAEEEADAE